mmetsp:Transcript_45821/g.74931  ORF Transcript_45821/g.74931 Transcript_45821/m.74931 type:complete len:442 (-) Transcript_45821:292-1617(-)
MYYVYIIPSSILVLILVMFFKLLSQAHDKLPVGVVQPHGERLVEVVDRAVVVQLAQQVRPRDHARQFPAPAAAAALLAAAAARAALGHQHLLALALHELPRHLLQRRPQVHLTDVRRPHVALDRPLPQALPQRLVHLRPADRAQDVPPAVHHGQALDVVLPQQHVDALQRFVRGRGQDGAGHELAGGDLGLDLRLADLADQLVHELLGGLAALELGVVQPQGDRRRLRVAPALPALEERMQVDRALPGPGAADHHHVVGLPVHLLRVHRAHQQHVAVGQVQHVLRHPRQPIDVPGAAQQHGAHGGPVRPRAPDLPEGLPEHGLLRGAQRRVQELRDRGHRGPLGHEPGEGGGVARRGRVEGERARVRVHPQRQQRGLRVRQPPRRRRRRHPPPCWGGGKHTHTAAGPALLLLPSPVKFFFLFYMMMMMLILVYLRSTCSRR